MRFARSSYNLLITGAFAISSSTIPDVFSDISSALYVDVVELFPLTTACTKTAKLITG
jgi:hypothetical protein